MVLGSLVSVGLPYDTYDHLTKKLSQVTPEQIQAVAKKYLTRDNLTVGTLLPNGQKASKAANQFPTSGGLR
jgi:zinc protease